ncbi:hypothetical protein B0A55_01868 [Friedmanniomyces simplex]|uniref:Fe2OG dioxygenase domain-containing protein n=1 Tax=Friedmanniomyces simplex TaxID=329884 RepID=A0A4U0XSK8_9PEZI|nr:hypothetical protein B0A55_01868 [Friedmanniomyces simplex]
MATTKSTFRWRTPLEVAAISTIIYILLGTPGLPTWIWPDNTPVHEASPRAKVESLVYPDPGLQCPEHNYQVHIFSTTPLIIYIDNFLSPEEATHLIDLSSPNWQTSTVFNAGIESTNSSIRKSEKALLPRTPTVQCLETRALSFQGWPPNTAIERLWTQRYNVSGHYAHHYDWSSDSRTARRASTFMVYLGAECTGGGTEFPRIARPVGDGEGKWCEFIECEGGGEGVTFKPRAGSAVFWMNFDTDGRGYKETIHAGLPVTSGTKIGLNIWSWYQAGHVPG